MLILQATPEEISDQIFKFARKGMTPSQIGIVLRDSYGIPQVKTITGNKIVRILKTASEFQRAPLGASCLFRPQRASLDASPFSSDEHR